MNLLVEILVLTAFTWVAMMIVMVVANWFIGFGLPGPVPLAWKLALIMLATAVVGVLLGQVSGALGFIASVLVFFGALERTFGLDLLDAIIIAALYFAVWAILNLVVIASIVATG